MNWHYLNQLDQIEFVVDIIRLYIINLYTYYIVFKIVNIPMINRKRELPVIALVIGVATLALKYIKDEFNFLYFIISTVIFFGCLFYLNTKNKFGYSIIITMISLTINYIVFSISTFFAFLVFSIFDIQSQYINVFIILMLYISLIFGFSKVKKFSKGFTFLKTKLNNEYFDILILNISCIILFSIILLSNDYRDTNRKLGIGLIVFVIIMFITIQKSLQLSYKQKMLIKDLEETKKELEEKKKEVAELEKENLEFSKVSHSIAHKQRALEYKLNELSMKSEIADEINIKDRIDKIGKSLNKGPVIVLDKTEIPQIDDMLKYMQSECVKNKIDFQLQLSGNIYTMINHYISVEELEILLADHIKNAIIAIGYANSVNKSILVRLGKLDRNYGLYIYDSGIEFEIETLLNLGKKPSTTHKDNGGTGMGFMNTFDTLRKHKASFIIEEYGKPVKDNFTKALKFKFDNKNEFKIYTYRKEEIKNKDEENTLIVEKLQ